MKLSINNDDSEKLLAAGFTLWEINEFANAKTPDGQDQQPVDLNKKVWIKALKSRSNWYNKLIADGWTYQQYERSVYDQYNRNPNQSPWDFLKSEYKPPQKADFKTTMEATTRVRNFKTNVTRTLRQERKKMTVEEQSSFNSTLGETINRLNREGR